MGKKLSTYHYVTGGRGFIGSQYIKYLLENTDHYIICIDGRLSPASDQPPLVNPNDARIKWVDMTCQQWQKHQNFSSSADRILITHFAAESHVDNSISGPADTIENNIGATVAMLEFLRQLPVEKKPQMIVVGTDEVYGQHESYEDKASHPEDLLKPRSPYSSSKAACDLIALSYATTYGLNVKVSRCCNNFGYNQYHEKLIPLTLLKWLNGHPMGIYGDGKNIREWIHVEDHCKALLKIHENFGRIKDPIINISSHFYMTNLDVLNALALAYCEYSVSADSAGIEYQIPHIPEPAIKFIEDRKGHDRVYKLGDTARSCIPDLYYDKSNYDEFLESAKQTIAFLKNNRTTL